MLINHKQKINGVINTCVEVHLPDLIIKREEWVRVRQVKGQRKREQDDEEQRWQARVLNHGGGKKVAVNP